MIAALLESLSSVFFGVFSQKKTIIFGVCREAAIFWGLFLELNLEFFGAKRQFFLEVIFGVFESLDLWSSNILSSETHKIEREIASETLYMDFFRRCAALLS